LASVLQKRRTLHRQLAEQQSSNEQLKSQIEQMETLANLGMVSAMIAHEMNNILTPLGSYAQLAINHPEDKNLVRKTIQKTAANSQRAAKILESVLAMATGRGQAKTNNQLKALLDDVFVCLARDFAKDRIKVTIEIPEDLTISAQAVCLQQVLMNLILNAREAMLGKGGNLRISARQVDDSVQIKVADTGCEIEPENLSRIFEPFYTTKNGQSQSGCLGAGLGLAFCKKVIDGYNGIISVESKPGDGTTFTIILPKYS